MESSTFEETTVVVEIRWEVTAVVSVEIVDVELVVVVVGVELVVVVVGVVLSFISKGRLDRTISLPVGAKSIIPFLTSTFDAKFVSECR